MEVDHVVTQIRLADLGIGGGDVHDKGAEIDGIETCGGAVKNCIVDLLIAAVNWLRVMVRGPSCRCSMLYGQWHWWRAVPCI